jgi:hypothetical protein
MKTRSRGFASGDRRVGAALIVAGLLAVAPGARAQGVAPPPPARRGGPVEGQQAVITGFEPQHCVDRGGVVTIRGALFGSRPDGRRAVLGGHGISVTLSLRAWTDRRIEVIVPDVERIEDGQWYYIGLQDDEHRWITNISRTITMCRGLE